MHDFPTPDVWLAHRVSYGETDTMGYLYYAEYLHLFERSRSEYIREMGMSYAEVERLGIMLPVREAQCRYRRPARYDDLKSGAPLSSLCTMSWTPSARPCLPRA